MVGRNHGQQNGRSRLGSRPPLSPYAYIIQPGHYMAEPANSVNLDSDEYLQQRRAEGAACLEAALDYLRRGGPVLPLCPPDHLGVGKEHVKKCTSPGKTPLIYWTEYQDRAPTEEEVRSWWKRWPYANVGVALGRGEQRP